MTRAQRLLKQNQNQPVHRFPELKFNMNFGRKISYLKYAQPQTRYNQNNYDPFSYVDSCPLSSSTDLLDNYANQKKYLLAWTSYLVTYIC